VSALRTAGRAVAAVLIAAAAAGQSRISGRVVIAATGEPARGAEVMLHETGAVTNADSDGNFAFEGVRTSARITIHADLGLLWGEAGFTLDTGPGTAVVLPEPVRIAFRGATHEHVTVTAASGETSGLARFGSVSSIAGLALLEGVPSLAELLESAPGVAIRSLGPGAARPIIRGFDGDRVLITEDGVRTGDIGSQAAEQGTFADPTQAERIEVVRGPAALLYGTNAVGGVVNLVSRGSQLAHSGASGFQGHASLGAGSADDGRYGGARMQAGGDGWFAWGGGNTRRTGDYRSPLGSVDGSRTAMDQGEAGFGVRGGGAYLSAGVRLDDSRYGVPLAGMLHGAQGEEEESVEVAMERRQVRTDFGFEGLGGIFDAAAFTVRYSEFGQDEIATEGDGLPELETHHDNRSLVFRGALEKSRGRLQGRVGGWANLRDFASGGPEALAPDTRHTALAAFALGALQASDRVSLLLGTRVENNAYDADARPEPGGDDDGHDEEQGEELPDDAFKPPAVVDRAFLGTSASAGLSFDLDAENTLVGTATVSTRAPALEELYNFGLDAGIQAFEIGNPLLEAERARGFDLSFRRDSGAFAGSAGVFRYDIENFTYAATAGGQGGVTVISAAQADSRHLGFEADGRLRLGRADLAASASWVDAKFPEPGQHAPRIPPLNGAVKLDVPFRGLRVAPRLRWAARMDRLYAGETPTGGYAVLDVTVSWLRLAGNATHHLSLVGHNLTDAVYRRHTSVIKDVAPQVGRGVRISYSIRFFRG
jgi:iron complex outermembrane receptor protein